MDQFDAPVPGSRSRSDRLVALGRAKLHQVRAKGNAPWVRRMVSTGAVRGMDADVAPIRNMRDGDMVDSVDPTIELSQTLHGTAIYMPISWGGLRGQWGGIYGIHGVSGYYVKSISPFQLSSVGFSDPPRQFPWNMQDVGGEAWGNQSPNAKVLQVIYGTPG